MSTSGELPQDFDYDSLSIEDLARLQGVKPAASLDELGRDVFESDEEVDEFIAFTYAARRRNIA